MKLSISIGEHRTISSEGVRAPHLFKLRNGDLLLTFHLDPDVHFPQRRALRSADCGETWQPDQPRCYKEMAWGEDGNGTVLAFERDTFEVKEGRFIGRYSISKDGGKSFDEPRECTLHIPRAESHGYPTSEAGYPEPEHIMRKFFVPIPEFYKPMIAKASSRRGMTFWRYMIEVDGLWLATMQGRFYGDNSQRSILVVSEDEGRTWRHYSTIAYEFNKLIDGTCEPVMRRVADGSLLCMMRRHGVSKASMVQCRSTDNGRTWSVPEIQPAHGVDPDMCLMSNGVLACTYGRPGLHLMFSEDGSGLQWGHHTEIASCQSSGMMGMAEIGPGKLLLVYDKVTGDSPDAKRNRENCCICATTVTVERTNSKCL
jgi:BNR repeat-like domain